MEYDLIVIGAGASGLTAAIAAARQGGSVLVIEHKEKVGKKILATGNGKCNFTNLYQGPECYRSNDSSFAGKVLSQFDVHDTIRFFEELGIYPKERDGYLYPNSEQAASVVSVLMMECSRLKVQFCLLEKVVEIKKPYYTVITESLDQGVEQKRNPSHKNKDISGNQQKVFKAYYSKQLIIATGGCASPKLGSDGSGYQLGQALGHSIIKPLPALVQLKSMDKFCKTLSGVRTQAVVSALAQGDKLWKESGEILFTDYGISGIPIMQLSRFVSKSLDQNHRVYLSLDFMPYVTKNELMELLVKRIQLNPNKNTEEMFVGLLNNKLSYVIILESKLDPYKNIKTFSEKELNALIHNIKDFRMNINDTNSFENAQVCSGGIATQEIDDQSMESKIRKGLYFAGEIIDVDGTCGGYNLQWAWSSGYLAGCVAGRHKLK